MKRTIQKNETDVIDDGIELAVPDTTTAVTDTVPVAEGIKPEPQTAPAEQNSSTMDSKEKQDKEEKKEEKKEVFRSPFSPMVVDDSAVLEFGEGKYRIPLQLINYYRGLNGGTLNEPIEITMLRNSSTMDDDAYENQMMYAMPPTAYIDRCAEPKAIWSNNVIAEGFNTAPMAVRPKADELVNIYSASNNLGQRTKWTFHNCGAVIYTRPAMDSELINLEMTLIEERNNVGLTTYGTLLSADMGVHLGTLIDFALSLVVWTNIEHNGDMAAALRAKLRGRESIDILLAAAMASMYPHGFPWAITCSNLECSFEESTDIFFARTQWVDMSRLTEKNLNILHRSSKKLTDIDYTAYIEEMSHTTDTFVYGNTTYHLVLPGLADYAFSTRRWVNAVEKENAEALARIDNEVQRSNFLDTHKAARSLVQYSHYVSKLEIDRDGVSTIIDDRDRIEEALKCGSADIELVAAMISHIGDFELRSRMTMIGHRNRECPQCKEKLRNTDDKAWSAIVPLPVDRIFFMHMRLKTQLLRGTTSRL